MPKQKTGFVPVPVEDAFKKRREKINLQNDITDEQTMFLLALNQKLTGAQEQVMEFLNFINYIVSLKDASNLPAMGSVTLVCYTAADNYPYIRKWSDSQKSFYRQRFSVEELLKSLKSYTITDKVNTVVGTEILAPLPQQFQNEPFCFFFFFLLSKGLLAITDLLNISVIELVLTTGFAFSEEKVYFSNADS